MPRSIIPAGISFWEEEAAIIGLSIFQLGGFVNWKFSAGFSLDMISVFCHIRADFRPERLLVIKMITSRNISRRNRCRASRLRPGVFCAGDN
jgi:hypothetical protein